MVDFLRVRQRQRWARRDRRRHHVGNGIFGTKARPRLSIYRSHRHFHSQLIDDLEGRTLASASTLMKELREQVKNGGDKKAAALVGEKLAEKAKAGGITRIIFDRNFYRFHGRVRAFAEAAAKGGLEFLVNPKKKGKPPKKKKSRQKPDAKGAKKKKDKGAKGGKGGGKPDKQQKKKKDS